MVCVSFSELCCDWVRLGSVRVEGIPNVLCSGCVHCTRLGVTNLEMVLWWLETMATPDSLLPYILALSLDLVGNRQGCCVFVFYFYLHGLTSNTNIACEGIA